MIPTESGGASTDLQKRFETVLNSLEGRAVGADALFDTLRLEVLDWRLDHGVDDNALRSTGNSAEPMAFKAPAPPEEAPS